MGNKLIKVLIAYLSYQLIGGLVMKMIEISPNCMIYPLLLLLVKADVLDLGAGRKRNYHKLCKA
jgi:hypothetical protein